MPATPTLYHTTQPDVQRQLRRETALEPDTSWLTSLPALPALTAVLGISDDGLPVLFDLQDERPGGLLLCGDPETGKTRVLESLLCSALAYNNPRQVQFILLADDLEKWRSLLRGIRTDRYGLAVCQVGDPEAAGWIDRLAEVVLLRREQGASGPVILLLIDGYQELLLADSQVRWQLDFLLDHGPSVGVWPVASISARAARKMNGALDRYGTRIYGRIAEERIRSGLSENAQLPEHELPGGQFAVQAGGQWLLFQPPA